MKSEGFFMFLGIEEKNSQKTLKNTQKLTKTLTEALRTYKNSHRTRPNLQKLSQTLTNSQKLSIACKCLKQSYLCLRRSLNKGTQMSRFRKKLSKPSKNSQKTLKNSQLLVSAWNRATFAYAVPLTRELKCQDLEKLSKNSQKLSKKPPFSAKNSQKLSKKGQNST